MSNPQYRWSTPYEWLETASRQWDQDLLRQQFLLLAIKADSDTLQDMYQDDMDSDGYFDPLTPAEGGNH